MAAPVMYGYCGLDPAGQLHEKCVRDLAFCPLACLDDEEYSLTIHVGAKIVHDPTFPDPDDVLFAWFGREEDAPGSLNADERKLRKTKQPDACSEKVLGKAKDFVAKVRADHEIRFATREITGESCSFGLFKHQVLVIQVRGHRVSKEIEKAFEQIHWSLGGPSASDLPAPAKLKLLGALCSDAMSNKYIRRQAARSRVVCGEEQEASRGFETSRWVKVRYIAWPPCLFFAAFMFQSFMLHICTHFYIKYMEKREGDDLPGNGRLFDIVGNIVARSVAQDGNAVAVPLWLLDLSGATPIGLCFFANVIGWYAGSFSIGLWNKQFIVGAVMAILKGIFDVVTVLPDSIGWDTCKERLHKSGLHAFEHVNFLTDFGTSLRDMIFVEIFGDGTIARVRYCADMMISGHTYFAFLFSMAAYNAIRHNADTFPGVRNVLLRRVVYYLCICCITLEIALVGLARFHYTVDMLAAIVFVMVLYDSRAVDQIAADWSEGFFWRDPEHFVPRLSLRALCMGGIEAERRRSWQRVVPSKAVRIVNMRDSCGYAPWSYPSDQYAFARRHQESGPPASNGDAYGSERVPLVAGN